MNTVNLMWLSFIGYIILQLYAVVRWTGAWRKHALFSLILMSLITVYTIYGLIMKSNLWPLLLLFASPLAFLYILILFVLRFNPRCAREMNRTVIRLIFIYRLIGIAAILAGAWVFVQIPFMKLSTPAAIRMIEENHIRQDLSIRQQENFQFCKGWIIGNDKRLRLCWWNARLVAIIGMPIMGVLLILSTLKRRQNNMSER